MKRTIILFIVFFAHGACSDKEKVAELENRISVLETQLDDCKNGADKLLAKLIIAFEEKNYSQVKVIYSEFKNRHPESLQFIEARSIYDNVLIIEEYKKQEAKIEAKLKLLKKNKDNRID